MREKPRPAVMQHREKPWFGVQFHPKVTHTTYGEVILRNFVTKVCGCAQLWNTENIIHDHIERVRTEVGKEQVLLGLSGGVDSSVVAALYTKP